MLTDAQIIEWLNSDCEWPDVGQTWREALSNLLQTILIEDEGFSGKRPFGNGGWCYDVAVGLHRLNPKIVTEWGEDDDLDGGTVRIPETVDWKECHKTIRLIIPRLFK